MRHTLDLGLYEPRRGASKLWGEPEFRGWGGSSHPDVTLSAEGFSTEAQYTASPRVEVPGKTTRGFIPGRIRPGQWAVELGVGAVIAQTEGDADGKVKWRVEIELSEDPAFKDEPYVPAPLRQHSRPPQAGLVRRRHARARRALQLRRGDHDRDLLLRLPAARPGRGRARLHHALRLRVGLPGLERDRALPVAPPGQPGDPQRRGDHLQGPHQQPRQRQVRGLPDHARLRARWRTAHSGS